MVKGTEANGSASSHRHKRQNTADAAPVTYQEFSAKLLKPYTWPVTENRFWGIKSGKSCYLLSFVHAYIRLAAADREKRGGYG